MSLSALAYQRRLAGLLAPLVNESRDLASSGLSGTMQLGE